jgi:hypothetical protein
MSPSSRSLRVRSGRRARGFGSLAALLVVLLSLGAADGGGALQGEARKRAVTDRRIEHLSRAVLRYYEDMREWPTAFNKLVNRPAGATRWAGSYIPVRFANFEDLRDRTVRDGWGRKMSLHYCGWDGLVFSSGPDGVPQEGEGDDRGHWINADQALWKETKREMRVLNTMIASYNANNPGDKLPPSFEGAYNKLRVRGYLPSTTPAWKRDYWRDGWNNKYDAQKGGHPKTIVRAYSNGRP